MSEQLKYPNCEKEKEHSDEWNAIAPFFEWLSEEKRAYLAVNEVDEREGFVIPYTVPIAVTLTDLMKLWHEYVGVDEAELERERRRILEELRIKQNLP